MAGDCGGAHGLVPPGYGRTRLRCASFFFSSPPGAVMGFPDFGFRFPDLQGVQGAARTMASEVVAKRKRNLLLNPDPLPYPLRGGRLPLGICWEGVPHGKAKD